MVVVAILRMCFECGASAGPEFCVAGVGGRGGTTDTGLIGIAFPLRPLRGFCSVKAFKGLLFR